MYTGINMIKIWLEIHNSIKFHTVSQQQNILLFIQHKARYETSVLTVIMAVCCLGSLSQIYGNYSSVSMQAAYKPIIE